jgi:hypothetical protein
MNFFRILKIAALVMICLFICSGCKKSQSAKARVEFYLTDAPGVFSAVHIDFRSLMLKSESKKYDIQLKLVRPGVYDVVKFTNGKDTLLGSAELPLGVLNQYRLFIGKNCKIIVDGNVKTLSLSPDTALGYAVNFNFSISDKEIHKLWLDFDVSRSVIKNSDETYSLHPVFRVFSEAQNCAVKGVIKPVEARSFVWAINETDTIGTLCAVDGKFMIRGLDAGAFRIKIIPQNGIVPVELESRILESGKTVDLGTFVLN